MSASRRRKAKFVDASPASTGLADANLEDTALRALTPAEKSRLVMDSWEPSLLRALLEAENRLPARKR